MELNLKRQAVAVCEPLLAAAAEQPLECELLLPDYCPDIVRVLSCRIDASAADCRVNSGVFTVEGMACADVCYMAEMGGMRKASCKIPFSRSFDLSEPAHRPVWSVNVRQGHVNCRAVSRRRLDIRGAVVISARVYDCGGRTAISEADGMGVQLLEEEISAVQFIDRITHGFSVGEMLSPQAGKGRAAEIVSVKCTPTAVQARVASSRILLRGELAVHLLYKTDPDSGETETADYTIPISRTIDKDGPGDDCFCPASLQCLSSACTVDELSEGEIRLDVQLSADVWLFCPAALRRAADSFSTLYPTEGRFTKMRIAKSAAQLSERMSVKHSVPLPDGMSRLLDVTADIWDCLVEKEEANTVVTARVKYTCLISTEDTAADAFTHTGEAKMTLPLKSPCCEQLLSVAAINACGVAGPDALELGCELLLSGTAVEWEEQDFLTDLAVDETSPVKKDPEVGLVIYYADAGERVWDIAKRFGSLPARITEENGLSSGAVETGAPLIIPTV